MTTKKIIDLPFAPGIYTEETDRGATGRWKDGNNVRFRYGLPEKIGGWTQLQPQFLGTARNIIDWASLDGALWTAIGTDWKLYLWQSDGTLSDITPIRRTVVLVDPFDTTIGSQTVVVTDPSHGCRVNDFVTFSGATAVGGLTLNGEYQVTAVTAYDTYEFDAGSAASGTANGGGTVTAAYQINTGRSSTGTGTGWGTGYWSQETWGTPRTTSGTVIGARTWSLDNWGEDLIAAPFGGSMYWWDRTFGPQSRAVLLEEAPQRTNIAIISQRDRHLFALGATDQFTNRFDPLLIRWCSTEDLNDWIPTTFNTSGLLRLYRGSRIVAAVKTRGQILAFTNQSVHSLDFIGGNDIYGINVVGENVTILGPNAAVATDYRVYFMGEGDFFMYDGVLRVMPSDVRNFVYEALNNDQSEKIFAGLNREFNEIWWFYPGRVGDQRNPANPFSEEINRYVMLNYEENTWSYGAIVRTAWQDRSPVLNKPYAASTDGYLYQHETGTDDDAAPLVARIESYDMELPDAGEYLVHIDQLIPDFLNLTGQCNVTMNGRQYPQDPTLITKGPFPVDSTTRKISLRFRGRQVSIEVESDQLGDEWRMGKWRARAGAHGKR